MASFEVRIAELPGYVARMRSATLVMRREMTNAMRRAVLTGEGRSKRIVAAERRDTSHLLRGITSDVTQISSGVRGVWGTTVPYGRVIHDGRRPGAAMPPQGALVGWMRRHGIPASAEFVVRRAIARRGIKAVPFLRRALQEVRPQIRREFEQVPKRVIAHLRGR